jgi:hypothetical protein
MPIVKPRTRRVKRVRHVCQLLEPTRNVLMDYARFISDSPDYVLNTLIDTTLAKDRDFVAWRAEQTAALPASPPTDNAVAAPRARTAVSE